MIPKESFDIGQFEAICRLNVQEEMFLIRNVVKGRGSIKKKTALKGAVASVFSV